MSDEIWESLEAIIIQGELHLLAAAHRNVRAFFTFFLIVFLCGFAVPYNVVSFFERLRV